MSAFGHATIFKDLECEILKGLQSRKSFNLLYSAKGEVDVDQFHMNCDGKGPTVTLIYGKYNTVFGGYTSQSWSSDTRKLKRDDRAFLFYKYDHADAQCVIMPIKGDKAHKAITCDQDFGPTFGGGDRFWDGYDLQAFRRTSSKSKLDGDGCFTLNGAICIGFAYQCNTDEGLVETNDINGGKMLVKEFEVYQVIDDLLEEPWIKRPNDQEKNAMKERLENLDPLTHFGIESFNILMVGAIGAGKSSFCNTLASAFANKIKDIASVAEEETSITNKVYAYTIKAENKENLKIKLFDIRGFDETRTYDYELELILEGRIPPGYIFEDLLPPTPQKNISLKKDQTLNDEIHLVCLVVDTTKHEVQSPELMALAEDIKRIIRKKDIPLVAVATKFDQLCPKISEDANHIYHSPKARDATKAVSAAFGIKLRHVFPIVNYSEDREISEGKDRLALQALNSMIQLAQDHLKHNTDDTLKEPWRERPDDQEMNDMEKKLGNLKPLPHLGIESFNILMVGAIGAGKSSFYNTLASVFANKIKVIAQAGEEETSVTNEVNAYTIQTENGKELSIRIFDIRGFDEKRPYEHELQLILDGRIQPGYVFEDQPTSQKDTNLKNDRTLNEEIHLVSLVADITKVVLHPSELKKQAENIKKVIRKKGIPLVAVATKFDQICPKIRNDANRLYNSPRARDAAKVVSEAFGIQLRHVFPIVNCTEDCKISNGKKRLALQALNNMVQLTQDHFQYRTGMPTNNDTWSERLKSLRVATQKEEREKEITELSEELSLFDDKEELRVLCFGTVHSGKSSFIDSILSALTGKICSKATGGYCVDSTAEVSTTEKFELYQIKHKSEDGHLKASKVYFGDMPGIQKDRGLTLDQAKRIVDGHVPNRYKILDGIKDDSQCFEKKPKLKDRIHCVCFVIDISALDDLSQSSIKIIDDFQKWLSGKNTRIPYIVVATKCDEASLDVRKDVLQVYQNKKIKAFKDKLVKLFKFRENKIYPVRNYVNERQPIPEFDALLLDAFREVLNLGYNYLEDAVKREEENHY